MEYRHLHIYRYIPPTYIQIYTTYIYTELAPKLATTASILTLEFTFLSKQYIFRLQPCIPFNYILVIRQYCLFVSCVITFAPEQSESANVTTRATNKQYDPTKVVLLSLSPIYKDK